MSESKDKIYNIFANSLQLMLETMKTLRKEHIDNGIDESNKARAIGLSLCINRLMNLLSAEDPRTLIYLSQSLELFETELGHLKEQKLTADIPDLMKQDGGVTIH